MYSHAAQLARTPTSFDVRLIEHEDHALLRRATRAAATCATATSAIWNNDDLQSFTPLRFMPPELMGYEGRARRDRPRHLRGRRRLGAARRATCRARRSCAAQRGRTPPHLLRVERHAARLREARRTGARRATSTRSSTGKRDYTDWICLRLEAAGDDRPARARVERLRPADARDQDAPQHAAQDAAVEDRPAGRLRPGREQPAQPGRCC